MPAASAIRSSTWPPSTSTRLSGSSTPTTARTTSSAHASATMLLYKTNSAPCTTKPPTKANNIPASPQLIDGLFEHDLNKHPEDHFLSPVHMYEYDDWADDSDDDEDPADEIDWDAGITDFALFDSDRRRAAQRHERVPDRWDGLVESQKSALQRAVLRNRANSEPIASARQWTPLIEDVPQLTPDNSPNLRGEHDIHSFCTQKIPRPSIPKQDSLFIKVTPPPEDEQQEVQWQTKGNTAYDDEDDYNFEEDEDEASDSDEDDLPVSFLVARARERRRVSRQMERPGLRFSRTMSGKSHVWRRPSYQLYSVGEDTKAESEAEADSVEHDCATPTRGRTRRC